MLIAKVFETFVAGLEGRVEKTDPRSADYPLTPAPRTTLRTTPRTTLRTTPTDYPKKSTKFLLRSTKIQKAYLLFLHDHNCTKNSRHFLFLHFSTQSFSFCPILHRPATCQNAQWTIGKRCWIFIFVICLKCLPSTLTFANKQLFWIFLPSRELEIIEIDARTETTNRWTKLMLW